MTVPRWRLATWAFLVWNVAMVGLVWLVLAIDRCSDIEWSQAMACGYGAAYEMLFELAAIAIVWPIGLVAIGVVWLHGARRAWVDGAIDGCLVVVGAIAISLIVPLVIAIATS